MPPLRLLVDENIPHAADLFGSFGEARLMPGREITHAHLKDVDALIVRSVTKVDADLIEGTPVKFIGSATTGDDHLDTFLPATHGVKMAVARGCNTDSVVNWVVAALVLRLFPEYSDWDGATLGVVGHGRIGSRVAQAAAALGMYVLICDPPLRAAGGHDEFVDLPELLERSNIVTLHVPITTEGDHPTHHMIGREQLERMGPNKGLLNSARGAVVDNEAVLEVVGGGQPMLLAFDTFEDEPAPSQQLVDICRLATPHIAGYTVEGKVRGTMMIADALADHLALTRPMPIEPPRPPQPVCEVARADWHQQVRQAVRHAYDIGLDDKALRAGMVRGNWRKHFDTLRRDYPRRFEFTSYAVRGPKLDPHAAQVLEWLGFAVA